MGKKRIKHLTDEDLERKWKMDEYSFFGSKYKHLTEEEIAALPIHATVTESDETEEEDITNELKALGYSGNHFLIKDGPITRVIPLKPNGEREDI